MIEVGKYEYKFIKTYVRTTRDEAEQLGKDNEGHLAETQSEED